MTKIKTYDSDGVITDKDKVIGSDGDNALVTRNYTFKEIRDFIKQGLSPEIGGTLKLTELTYNGGLYSTPQAFVNSLDPIVTVLKYELVIVSVNGNKWLFRKYDTTIGVTETPTTLADFVSISTVSDGSQTKIVNGTNTTVSGNGTIATPYTVNVSLPTINDATNSVKGILKLTGDLGGTADAPTTPTALHISGNENFTGTKSATNTANTAFGVNSGISLINAGSNNNGAVFKLVNNIGSQRGISIDNQGIYGIELKSNGAVGMYIDHLSTSTAISIDQSNTTTGTSLGISREGAGKAIFINDLANTGTGDVIVYAKGNANATLFKLSDDGSLTANSYIKTGGTATQMLMADGSVKENQDNLQREITGNTTLSNTDNNHTIFINNGATPITITINTTVTTANFGVGFIQEGTGDVTFVGTGVTLTNPVGLKSKGQGYATYIERKLNTSSFFLLGDTKV